MLKQFVFILSFAFVTLAIFSCGKDSSSAPCVVSSTGVATTAEIASLQAYITSRSITATQDPSGFFYTINNPGSGSTASISSIITVSYVGKLQDGTTFDSTANPSGSLLALSQTILGWQKGIPKIQKGGNITLYVPASLGYGCTAQSGIPAGSNLIFTINLLNIQ